ncbi:MAG: hypothetical protein JF606_22685 [Burkholderiales bacterium]|jgi:hypothetical protein|nr:hypothetical protein [Burkholderiales bacterium]
MALLIPDSGPLFSLAAGGMLGVLDHFRLAITDVVKEEAVDPGARAGASPEARALSEFYAARATSIEVFATQVGHDLLALRKTHPGRPAPPNVGELSIQSLIIHLQVSGTEEMPVILFEDSWFLRNAEALARPCVVISTQAFLINAEKLGLIPSAEAARVAISTMRPTAYAGKFTATAAGKTTARRQKS